MNENTCAGEPIDGFHLNLNKYYVLVRTSQTTNSEIYNTIAVEDWSKVPRPGLPCEAVLIKTDEAWSVVESLGEEIGSYNRALRHGEQAQQFGHRESPLR